MEKQNIISIPCKFGCLKAEIGGDPNFPEIFTYIERPDGVQIDLVSVGENPQKNVLKAYLYGDTSTDNYTKTHSWSQEEIEIE